MQKYMQQPTRSRKLMKNITMWMHPEKRIKRPDGRKLPENTLTMLDRKVMLL